MDSKTLTEEPVSFLDVYNEFNNDIVHKYKIKNFKSKVSLYTPSAVSIFYHPHSILYML